MTNNNGDRVRKRVIITDYYF